MAFATRSLSIKILIFTATTLGSRAHAQWSTDPSVNNAISLAANIQLVPRIVSDGSGGAIITWVDQRNGIHDVYAQRINASGLIQWAADGVAISIASGSQVDPTIISDGSGGAIITWTDYRGGVNPDIYAQRINASGVIQWMVNGVTISTASGHQINPTIVGDGSGGAIVTWEDYRGGVNPDIYAQRINANGVIQWTADGVAISTAAGDQYLPTIISDGSGGAIITWEDHRGTDSDIYAHRINASGVIQWTVSGAAISTASGDQLVPGIVSDGSGGATITWVDERNGIPDVYAQRINASGVIQWAADGVTISTASGRQHSPIIISDGSEGAIIAWADNRSGNYDVYAQRINASGVIQWTVDGVAISAVGGDQFLPRIASHDSAGPIIAWIDTRAEKYNYDIYAQRINAGGAVQWAPDGVAVSIAADDQDRLTIVSDGSEGAIITWADNRSGIYDIYAQRVGGDGLLGGDLTDYCRTNVNKAIPDNNAVGVRDTLTISGVPPGHLVQSIALRIDSVTHTYVGDLYMTLTHNGVTRTLMNRPGTGNFGSSGDNFIGTAIIDAASSRIDEITGVGAPYTGLFRPDSGGAPSIVYSSLAPFIGSNPNGDWVLFVNDNAADDSGKVHSWCLILQTGVSTDVDPVYHTIPEVFSLEQNYPNPFNPTTTIRFALAVAANVTLKVYNVLGQEIVTLLDEPQNAGTFNATWDGRSNAGYSVASGLYFYQLTAEGSSSPEAFRSMKKMVLMK